jgi:hypothetical protein
VPDKKKGCPRMIEEIRIPIIDKLFSCRGCMFRQVNNKRGWCSKLKKPTNDCALECEPKTEWRRPE